MIVRCDEEIEPVVLMDRKNRCWVSPGVTLRQAEYEVQVLASDVPALIAELQKWHTEHEASVEGD